MSERIRGLRYLPVVLAVAVGAVWLVAVVVGDRWTLLAQSWPMGAAMVAGSFVAGSTMLGGGAVAFPVATLVFQLPPDVGRDFSLAIQAVGMTAATVTILALRIPVAWRVILPAILGSAVGVIVGLEAVAPMLPRPLVGLSFAALLSAFGLVLAILHLRAVPLSAVDAPPGQGAGASLLVGIAGGIVAGVIGTGADFVLFCLLVLRFGVAERIATPTSVVVMAATSVVAVLWLETAGGGLSAGAWPLWWACVPVVVIGAPLGAWAVSRWARGRIVAVLCALIAIQLGASLILLPRGWSDVGFALALGALALAAFGLMARSRRPLDTAAVRG